MNDRPAAKEGSEANPPVAPAYDRILLKLSGEALMGNDAYGINRDTVDRIVVGAGVETQPAMRRATEIPDVGPILTLGGRPPRRERLGGAPKGRLSRRARARVRGR